MEQVYHEIEPWYDSECEILILGTIPSPKSRSSHCYYGHPQNRFWKTLAAVYGEDVPMDVQERRQFVRKHRIALWDVLATCQIHGADDASISSPVVNNLSVIFEKTNIKAVFTTGKKAKKLYDDLAFPIWHREAVSLPSTSPANCRWWSDEALIEAYRVLLNIGS